MKHSTQEAKETTGPEYIGHITTPIESKQAEQILVTLRQHGVTPFPCKGDGHWWTLVLPPGSIKKNLQEADGWCVIDLPDEYQFGYLPPHFKGHAHDSYDRLPEIALDRRPRDG